MRTARCSSCPIASVSLDRFADLPWVDSPAGHPIVPDALGWLDCTIEAIHDGGDHGLVVARAIPMVDRTGEPLIFHSSRYTGLVAAAASPTDLRCGVR